MSAGSFPFYIFNTKEECILAYNNLNDWATSICDAIREKEGSSDPIPAPDIPERIRGIKSGEDIFRTSSMGMANSGSEFANVLQTEVTYSVSD